MRFVRGLVSFVLWVVAIPLLLVALARALPFDDVVPLPHLAVFTPWAAIVTLPVLIIALFSRRWVLTLLLAASMAGFVYWLAPFFVPAQTSGEADPAAGDTLRVMTVNAQLGRADPQAVVDLADAQNVEVLAVQELTPGFVDGLADAGLDDLLPNSLTYPAADSPAGSGLWSTTSLTEQDPTGEGTFAMPSALVEVGGTDVRVTTVHAYPPMPTDVSTWRADLADLTERVQADDTAQILAGDFNATYDHASFRELLGSRFTDVTLEWGAGPTPTWPEGSEVPPVLALDHVVVEKDMTASDVVAMQVDGTDHRAMVATVVVP